MCHANNFFFLWLVWLTLIFHFCRFRHMQYTEFNGYCWKILLIKALWQAWQGYIRRTSFSFCDLSGPYWYLIFAILDTYNIQSSLGIVGKFCLSRHYYRLGEDILGSFDFTDASLKCFKVSFCFFSHIVLRICKCFHHFCILQLNQAVWNSQIL